MFATIRCVPWNVVSSALAQLPGRDAFAPNKHVVSLVVCCWRFSDVGRFRDRIVLQSLPCLCSVPLHRRENAGFTPLIGVCIELRVNPKWRVVGGYCSSVARIIGGFYCCISHLSRHQLFCNPEREATDRRLGTDRALEGKEETVFALASPPRLSFVHVFRGLEREAGMLTFCCCIVAVVTGSTKFGSGHVYCGSCRERWCHFDHPKELLNISIGSSCIGFFPLVTAPQQTSVSDPPLTVRLMVEPRYLFVGVFSRLMC